MRNRRSPFNNKSLFNFCFLFDILIFSREIISILNCGTKLKIFKEDLLTQETTKIIIKHIQKRLATLSKSRYGRMELKEIIVKEANLLKRVIDEKIKYKGFVAKY